jgi:hypothetical protein
VAKILNDTGNSGRSIKDYIESLRTQLEKTSKGNEAADSVDANAVIKDFAQDLNIHHLRRMELLNKGLEDRNSHRTFYTDSIFSVVVIWLGLMLLFLLGKGLGKLELSDTVILTLLGTTTTGVVYLLHKVLEYLFGDKN